MEVIVEFLNQVNVLQLLAIGIMFWFFYVRLNDKIDKTRIELKSEMDRNKIELKSEIDKNKIELKSEMDRNKIELKTEMDRNKTELTDEIDKLSNKIEDIDRRLCRIEGGLNTHGHCLYNQSQFDKKAQ